GAWRVDDSSLVVTRGVLASGAEDNTFNSSSTVAVEVPIAPFGGTALHFTTTKNNQLVKLTYNGWCAVRGQRGRTLGLRMEVDGIEAAPASGFDFALCSSVASNVYYYFAGFRQSVITVPTAGDHSLRVLARASGSADWALGSR